MRWSGCCWRRPSRVFLACAAARASGGALAARRQQRKRHGGAGGAAVFVLIGLLDSLHFRPRWPEKNDGKVGLFARSAVAYSTCCWSNPLRSQTEKTYSAPLATRAFAKELVELPDGKQLREFPRLRYGGAHLKDEADRHAGRFVTCLAGLAVALLPGLLLFADRADGRPPRGKARVAWRVDMWRGETASLARHAGTLMLDAGCFGGLAQSGRALSRARHRQGRAGRALPVAEKHTHRPGHRHADHAGDAAVRRVARHHGGLFQGLGGRCHPVCLHHAQFHPGRAADRRGGADDAGLHRYASGVVSDLGAARRSAPAVPVHHPRPHQLDRAVRACCAARR